MNTFQNLNQNFNMVVNYKMWADLDLYIRSNLGVRVYAIERSYPKVGLGKI